MIVRNGFTRLLLVGLAIVGVCWMTSQFNASVAAEQQGRLLRHLVLYKFKADTTAAQVQEVIDAFSGLPGKIETIVAFEHGPNVSPEGKSDGLTYCFMVTFRDEKGRDAYLVHPAHQEYVKVVQGKRERVIVFDYWTGKE